MVDWNLDREPKSTVAFGTQQEKVSRRPRVRNSRPSRKARPLMENSNQHLQHSGVNRKSKPKLINPLKELIIKIKNKILKIFFFIKILFSFKNAIVKVKKIIS